MPDNITPALSDLLQKREDLAAYKSILSIPHAGRHGSGFKLKEIALSGYIEKAPQNEHCRYKIFFLFQNIFIQS